MAPVEAFPLSAWRRVLDINLTSNFVAIQAALPAEAVLPACPADLEPAWGADGELKARVADAARLRGITEAEVIRSALEQTLDRPRPRGALFASGNPLDAERVDELLAETGFGEWPS